MRRLALPAALLLAGCPAPADLDARALAIVGGAGDTTHPAVGAVAWDSGFLCSAVLVEPRLAFTAAHCLYGFPADGDLVTLRFGTDSSAPDAVVDVVDVELHPEFSTLPDRDVARLRLAQDAPVAPVPWRGDPLPGLVGDLLLVGFGDTITGAQDRGLRRAATVSVEEATPRHLRWQGPGGICDGDSGGAAFADVGGGEELIALLVEGSPTCGEWGAAARTDAFAPFLRGDPVEPGDDDDVALPDDDEDSGPGGCSMGSRAPNAGVLLLALLPGLSPLRRRRPLP
jgi:hypothetical protein